MSRAERPHGGHLEVGSGLGSQLDNLARRFGPGRVLSDPVRFPRRYADRADTEAAALIAALFAY